jgi:phospholipase D1/2
MRPILTEGETAWRILPVDEVAVLVDGEDYYRAFYEAALQAERTILLAGWQFDSDACLLRGPEVQGAPAPVDLLGFLEHLVATKPALQIRLLAWNFHVVFAMERQWLQELLFNWKTHDRIQFHFDDHHPSGASHHQKFVVIDGVRSFLGGIDLCDHRWDRRKHADRDELRTSRGQPHQPFHDAQVYLAGAEVGAALGRLFMSRWEAAQGEPLGLDLDAPPGGSRSPWSPRDALPLATDRVALSRTDPNGAPFGPVPCREVERLHLEAIAAAERSIYIETQYFSSRAVGEALLARLADTTRPIELVIVLNPHAESPKEDLAVGLAQAKILGELSRATEGTRHAFAKLHSLPECDAGEPERSTYVHSKLMIVDDCFVTIGSANLTNRSMGLDSELHASFQEAPGSALAASIRALRIGLVREHAGRELPEEQCTAAALLDAAARCDSRLRLQNQPTERERAILDVVDPQALPFDPEGPEDQAEDRRIFIGGIGALVKKLVG